MRTLFITSILEGDYEKFYTKIIVLGILYIIMLCAIILDLISGIRKAKHAGEFISSFALRRTIKKAVNYFNLALIFTLIDVILSMLSTYNMPYVTAFCACIVCIIEIKSIFEKYDNKEKAKVKDAARTLKYVLDHKNEILIILSEINSNNKTSKNEEHSSESDNGC